MQKCCIVRKKEKTKKIEILLSSHQRSCQPTPAHSRLLLPNKDKWIDSRSLAFLAWITFALVFIFSLSTTLTHTLAHTPTYNDFVVVLYRNLLHFLCVRRKCGVWAEHKLQDLPTSFKTLFCVPLVRRQLCNNFAANSLALLLLLLFVVSVVIVILIKIFLERQQASKVKVLLTVLFLNPPFYFFSLSLSLSFHLTQVRSLLF